MATQEHAAAAGETHELEVARVLDETADARSFVLSVPAGLREAFRYEAGQFLTVDVDIGGRTLRRCYSMSSAPEAGGDVKITVKRVAGGAVSNWLNDEVRPGTRLRLLKPAGRFTLTGGAGPILFFAGGSGITPVASLIKAALARTARRMTLLYANRNRASIIFDDEIAALARRHRGRLRVVHHLDDEAGPLGPAAVAAIAQGAPDAEAYLCGPPPFMALAETALADARFDSGRIFVERFLSPPAELAAGGGAACRMTIRLGGLTHEIEARPAETVLQAARRAGVDVPSACEQGICGTCVAKRVAGEVAMQSNQLLTDEEVADGLILACQALPRSDRLELEF